jgi:hypothetical protein
MDMPSPTSAATPKARAGEGKGTQVMTNHVNAAEIFHRGYQIY